jgi:hypothetical protein
MNTQHTPGPWQVHTYYVARHGITAQLVPYRLATVIGAFDQVDNNVPGPSCEANARLIAAAPELLAALRDTLEWLREGKVDGVGFDEQQVVDTISAAIAKAEGEQS